MQGRRVLSGHPIAESYGMYACVCMYVCTYVVYTELQGCETPSHVCVYACMYEYVYICVYTELEMHIYTELEMQGCRNLPHQVPSYCLVEFLVQMPGHSLVKCLVKRLANDWSKVWSNA